MYCDGNAVEKDVKSSNVSIRRVLLKLTNADLNIFTYPFHNCVEDKKVME